MAARTVLIQSRAHLSIKNGLLSVETDGGVSTIPLEDIWIVIVESHYSTLTVACLSSLIDAGIGVLICGHNHMPNGLMLPIGANSRRAAIINDQIAMSKPLEKQLWKRIVQTKISNQAAVLDELGISSDVLREYAGSVLSGDTDNREGAAAAAYFQALLPDGSRRSSARSSALDYGYGILRAGVGRAVAGGGWLVSRGIHHHSVYNAFNLVDDFIEPYRPLIDLIVMAYDICDPLSRQDKALLARVFEHTMLIDDKRCSCEQCIEIMVSSFRTAVLQRDASKLLLPKLKGLDRIVLE